MRRLKYSFMTTALIAVALVYQCGIVANDKVVRAKGERLVRSTALAGWKQLHSQVGD